MRGVAPRAKPFPLRLRERPRSPESRPEARPTERRPARQGIASAWRSAEAAFVPRARPLLAFPANPALLARPWAFSGPPRAVPAPSRFQHSATELSLLPSLSTSSTPRGVAPPCPQARPHNLPSLSSPFRSVSSLPATPALGPCRTARVSPALDPHVRACRSRGHSVCPLQLAAPDPAPGRASWLRPLPRTHALLARPPPGAGRPARGRFPLLPRSPHAPALALSKASALPAGALRAPASPGSCQCGDCAGKHGDRGNDPY